MRKLATATLCAIIGSNVFAADIASVNKVIDKLKERGIPERSECDPNTSTRTLEFENVTINGRKYDKLIASYATGVNASRALMFAYARESNNRFYIMAIGDGDDVGVRLDGQPDLAFERTFSLSSKRDIAALVLALTDPCAFEKSLETQGTKPTGIQRQLYDASIHFVLSQ